MEPTYKYPLVHFKYGPGYADGPIATHFVDHYQMVKVNCGTKNNGSYQSNPVKTLKQAIASFIDLTGIEDPLSKLKLRHVALALGAEWKLLSESPPQINLDFLGNDNAMNQIVGSSQKGSCDLVRVIWALNKNEAE